MDVPAEVLTNLGMVGVLILAMWQALRWAARRIAEPLIKSHIEFVGKVQASVTRQDEILSKLCDTQEQLVVCVHEVSQRLAAVEEHLDGESVEPSMEE